jgi:KilA-N domain
MANELRLPSGPPAPRRPLTLTHNGHVITSDGDGLVDLTAMWRAEGSPANKEPKRYALSEQGRGFIQSLIENLNVTKSTVWKSRRGKHLGGTWAHWQIAVAYAKYLSHDFHRSVNEKFRRWVEEAADPGLKVERAIDGYKARGRDDEWIGIRLEGILARKGLTSTMRDHNCHGAGRDSPYAEATRSISLHVIGKTPKEIKAAKGLAKSARTRDHLSTLELAALRFAETAGTAGTELIKAEAADGNAECVNCCRRAGKAVKLAVDSLKAPRGRTATA